jgi:hypothetical protein
MAGGGFAISHVGIMRSCPDLWTGDTPSLREAKATQQSSLYAGDFWIASLRPQ